MSKNFLGIFRDSLIFAHSHQSFGNFHNDILAQQEHKVYQVFSSFGDNISVFIPDALISVKVIMTRYRSYSVGTSN